jgi:Cu/Zn superoxide dismutase
VFKEPTVQGTVLVFAEEGGVRPAGKHGFHIHKAGDMRGSGCKGACEHWHVGPGKGVHGSRPRPDSHADRHTGDLGNVEIRPEAVSSRY